MLLYVSLGCLAFTLSLIFSWVVRDAALRLGLVDKPDQVRRFHARAVPRVGGIAIAAAFGISLFIVYLFARKTNLDVAELSYPRAVWLLLAMLLIFATGVIDDLAELKPLQKLAGQVGATLLVWASGLQVHVSHSPSLDVWLSLPITCLWLLLCTNAFNLIDGLDGLAAGTAAVSALAMLIAAILDHNSFLLLLTVPLIGALLGFLRYNFNPATIFLGDSGSLTIGFMLGCFGLLWSAKVHTAVGLLGPMIVIALPLFDTALAIARRFLRKRPIFGGDRGHIHHKLLDRGKSPRHVALTLYAGAAFAATIGVLDVLFPQNLAWIALSAFALSIVAAIRYLGYLEFRFAHRLLTKGVVFSLIDDHMHVSTLETRLRETTSPDEALAAVRRTCTDLGFEDVSVLSIAGADAWPAAGSEWDGCHVAMTLEPGYVLMLRGLPSHKRPMVLSELRAVISQHFRRTPVITPSATPRSTEAPPLLTTARLIGDDMSAIRE